MGDCGLGPEHLGTSHHFSICSIFLMLLTTNGQWEGCCGWMSLKWGHFTHLDLGQAVSDIAHIVRVLLLDVDLGSFPQPDTSRC